MSNASKILHRGPFIFAVERFLQFTDFYFRGFSVTLYQKYAILSVVLHFTDFYFRAKMATAKIAKIAKIKGTRKKGFTALIREVTNT